MLNLLREDWLGCLITWERLATPRLATAHGKNGLAQRDRIIFHNLSSCMFDTQQAVEAIRVPPSSRQMFKLGHYPLAAYSDEPGGSWLWIRSWSIVLVPWQFGQAIKGFGIPIMIVRLLRFHDIEKFASQHTRDQPLCFLLFDSIFHQTIVRCPSLRRLPAAELIIDDFKDKVFQDFVRLHIR